MKRLDLAEIKAHNQVFIFNLIQEEQAKHAITAAEKVVAEYFKSKAGKEVK